MRSQRANIHDLCRTTNAPVRVTVQFIETFSNHVSSVKGTEVLSEIQSHIGGCNTLIQSQFEEVAEKKTSLSVVIHFFSFYFTFSCAHNADLL